MFLVLNQLSLHKYRSLACLLQNTDKPEHPRIDESDFERGPIRQTTFRGGFHADRKVVRPEYRLLKLGRENRRQGYRQRLERRRGVGASPDKLLSSVGVIVKVCPTSGCGAAYPLICEGH